MVNALAQGEQDPIAGLALLLELYGRSLDDRQRMDARRVGIQGWDEALRNPTIHASVTDGVAAVRAEIVRLVARGQRAGQLGAELSPEAVARVLIATFQGLILQRAWGEDIDLPAVGDVIHAMIRGGLFTAAARAAVPTTKRAEGAFPWP